MNIFEYDNYKNFVNDWISAQPRGGYGLYSRIAKDLETNSVVISQIFKGAKELSLEKAAKLSRFLGLTAAECDFFLLLVQYDRAAAPELRSILKRQIKAQRASQFQIKNQFEHKQLDDTDKSKFYANWYNVAIWLAATIPAFTTPRQIAERLDIPEPVVTGMLQFLLERGLLVKSGGRYEFGQNVVHVPEESVFANKHHLNWRMRALQAMDHSNSLSLHYTAPVSLSAELGQKIRADLVRQIAHWTKQISADPSEQLMCMNIDWFQI